MRDSGWKVTVFLTLLAVEAALLVRLYTSPGDQQGLLIGAIIAVAAALSLVPRIFDLLHLQMPGFAAQLREVQQSIDATSTSVQATDLAIAAVNQKLDTLFVLSISDWQYSNLEKIVSGKFGSYVRSMGLENDLRHLRNHGYIDVPSVRELPNHGEELCDFVRATETGKLFVELRKSLRIPPPALLRQPRLEPAGANGPTEARPSATSGAQDAKADSVGTP